RVAASWGANILGMDLSLAVNSAKEMTADYHDHVQIIRGDLLRVPIREEAFDLVYSIGVLDHTPDPRQAFLNLAKCVKPGGRMAVWVYQVQSPKVEKIMKLHRSIASLLPVRWIERLSRWSVPIGGVKRKLMNSRIWIIQKLGLAVHALTIGVSMHPDPEVRACDTLDWYAPEFVSHHTPEEVEGWFREAGFSKVFDPTLDRPFFYEGQGQGVHRVGIK
ncbi:MAG: Demethylmenaquinone methyltransferase, partial [Planctomycetota bacterium]